jgi:hypothetical protein
MCIYDALLRALESRGYAVELTAVDNTAATTVTIADERVSIAIEERLNRVERKPDPLGLKARAARHGAEYDYVPTGRLALQILNDCLGVRRTWGDSAKQRVDARLNDFIVGIVVAAEDMRARRLEQQARQRQWEDETRRRQAAEERRLAEAARERALDVDVTDWRKSGAVRECAQAM